MISKEMDKEQKKMIHFHLLLWVREGLFMKTTILHHGIL